MPSDVIAVVVSTGISVSVIAGVLSCMCYVLAQGLKGKRNRDPTLQWWCVVCGTNLRSSYSENVKTVLCAECHERVCKKRCSIKNYDKREWVCYTCLKRSSLVDTIFASLRLRDKRNKSILYKENKQMQKKFEYNKLDYQQTTEYIRDFIEKLVSTILGESVDDASIFRMYNDEYYDEFFHKNHQALSDAIIKLSSCLQICAKNTHFCEQSPSSAHTNLKLLIENIIRDADQLPRLQNAINNSTITEEGNYEELLATAILNKIISKKNNYSECSLKNPIKDRNWEIRRKDLEWASQTSFFQTSGDSRHPPSNYSSDISFKIQQRGHALPATNDRTGYEGCQCYIYGENRLSLTNQSNWLLQKRDISRTNSPVLVPMLVPNPVTSAKVLIGDKEIDDASDLSDANSDRDDGNLFSGDIIIDSTLIIERNEPKDYFSDEETSFDSGVRDDIKDDLSEKEKGSNSAADDEDDASSDSSNKDICRDFEYLTIPVHTSLSTSRHNSPPRRRQTYSYRTVEKESLQQHQQNAESDFFKGSYSRREKEKWRNPVRMSYNPYSEENIRKRLEGVNQRFGTDYYAKQASLPSGRTRSEDDEVSLSNRIKQLEARCIYSSLPRSLYTPRNSTNNFVKNPLFSFKTP